MVSSVYFIFLEDMVEPTEQKYKGVLFYFWNINLLTNNCNWITELMQVSAYEGRSVFIFYNFAQRVFVRIYKNAEF